MNTKLKKSLYESIMKSVAKTVKTILNEDYYTSTYDEISDFLDNFWSDDNWYDEIYGALADDMDEDYEETTRLNLIDNGYCLTVCLCVSMNFENTEEGKNIKYCLLDDKGTSYHFFMEKDGYFYDAYNYYGVKNLSDLQFCKIYMKDKSEEYLRKYFKVIGQGEFDYEYAQSLVV